MPKNQMTKKERAEIAVKEEAKTQYNASILKHTALIAQIKTPDFKNKQDIERACQEYFSICVEENVKPTVSGLAIALGTNRTNLLNWLSGSVKIDNKEIILKYYALVETFDEVAMKDGAIPPVTAIFNAKNNYGYTDKTETKIINEDLSDEEIERKYRERHEVVSEQ